MNVNKKRKGNKTCEARHELRFMWKYLICQVWVTFDTTVRFSDYWTTGFESKWEAEYGYRRKLKKSNGINWNAFRNFSERNNSSMHVTGSIFFLYSEAKLDMIAFSPDRAFMFSSFLQNLATYHFEAHVAEHELCGWCPRHLWNAVCQWLHPGIQPVLEEKHAEKC